MDQVTSNRFLDTERGNTDRSLTSERAHTDRSINQARVEAENQTDKTLHSTREQTDQTRRSSRILSDLSANDEQLTPAGFQIMNARLLDERTRADKAVEQERSRVDVAIGREREAKSDVVETLLAQERDQTDNNLSTERSRTDHEVLRVSDLLTDEVASHGRTKTALTTRDEFLAIVSHDLRNPIGAVFACADMLMEEPFAQEPNSELKYWLRFIKRNASTALRLINDILDIERIAEGKLSLNFDRHEVLPLLRESIESFVYEASAKNILLRLKRQDDVGTCVLDRDRILQVLSNLIGNALKFTPEGGSVILEATSCGDEVLITVADTGPGISEEQREKVFTRFAQLGSPDRKGLGLGLYISKMLIDGHHGRIWVETSQTGGSTFKFSLPRQGPEMA